MTKAVRSKESQPVGLKRPRLGIREVYEDGTRILGELSKSDAHKTRNSIIEALANENRMSAAELWKRVRFAETYNEASLKELLEFKNLTWGHVRKLLTVEKINERRRFAANANTHGWSPRDMASEIEASLGVKNFGGRPTKKRRLTPGTLHSLKQRVLQLLRLFDAFGLEETEITAAERNQLKLCREQLPATIKQLEELKKALPSFMKKLEKVLPPLKCHAESAS